MSNPISLLKLPLPEQILTYVVGRYEEMNLTHSSVMPPHIIEGICDLIDSRQSHLPAPATPSGDPYSKLHNILRREKVYMSDIAKYTFDLFTMHPSINAACSNAISTVDLGNCGVAAMMEGYGDSTESLIGNGTDPLAVRLHMLYEGLKLKHVEDVMASNLAILLFAEKIVSLAKVKNYSPLMALWNNDPSVYCDKIMAIAHPMDYLPKTSNEMEDILLSRLYLYLIVHEVIPAFIYRGIYSPDEVWATKIKQSLSEPDEETTAASACAVKAAHDVGAAPHAPKSVRGIIAPMFTLAEDDPKRSSVTEGFIREDFLRSDITVGDDWREKARKLGQFLLEVAESTMDDTSGIITLASAMDIIRADLLTIPRREIAIDLEDETSDAPIVQLHTPDRSGPLLFEMALDKMTDLSDELDYDTVIRLLMMIAKLSNDGPTPSDILICAKNKFPLAVPRTFDKTDHVISTSTDLTIESSVCYILSDHISRYVEIWESSAVDSPARIPGNQAMVYGHGKFWHDVDNTNEIVTALRDCIITNKDKRFDLKVHLLSQILIVNAHQDREQND